MINAVYKRLLGFLGKVDIAADEGIFKAELADFTVLGFCAVLGDQGDFSFNLGLADRTGLVFPVDLEHAYRESALGRGVNIDKIEVFVIEIVRGLAADKEHSEERACLVAEHADIGRSQEGDRDALLDKEHLKRHRVFDRGVAYNEHLAAADTENLEDNDYGRDKVHRREECESVLAVEGVLSVKTDGFDRSAEVAVLVQNALGVACSTRGINRVGGIVVVGNGVTCLRLCSHQLVPALGVELVLAAAVVADIVDSVGCVCILNQRPCRACLPDADHRNNGHNTSGQIDQDKVLPAYSLCAEVGVYPAAHLVELSVCNTLGMSLVKQDCSVGLFSCILLKQFNDIHTYSPISYVRISSKPVTSNTSFTASLTLTSFISP